MNTEKVVTPQGDVLVVEVTPSFDTPVRYRGRTFVRIGPRRDIASAAEERILSERCAASLPTFDTRPCREATLDDIDLDLIRSAYLPRALDADVLANDHRPLKEQLAAVHLFNLQWDCPTFAALIMFGKNPQYFMPGAYIQYVRFEGLTNGGTILNERRFDGCLYRMLPLLENFVRDGVVTRRPVVISTFREKDVYNYPEKALRELLMNAVMHRDYQSSMPTRFYQYDDRVEIMNPGGLYGNARPENFPHVNDYRNNTLAAMMKTFNYVNMFNHGITEVQEQLRQNGNPPAVFDVNLITVFLAKVTDANEEDKRLSKTTQAANQGEVGKEVRQVDGRVKELIMYIKDRKCDISDILSLSHLVSKSGRTIRRNYLIPAIEQGYVAMEYPHNPHHPKQRYYLTPKGLEMLRLLQEK